MGKTGGGSSWLTAVKRAFRSPTKDSNGDTSSETRRSTRPRHHHDQQQEEHSNKKREKKGWLFRKPTNHEASHKTIPQKTENNKNNNNSVSEAEQRHAIAVAVATAKAAEAAVVTAQAAMEIARLAGPPPSYYAREHSAATVIQTSFRGYLARRALRALKGVVKLQAIVRGHNVRNQAKMTLQCMQALVRVQARVLDQRLRQSDDASSRKSIFSDTNSFWESNRLSRDGSSIAEEWDERAHTVEEVKAMLQHRKESAALKRERNLSHAFSQQMWRSNRNKSLGNEEEIGQRDQQSQWVDRWMPTKPWESSTKARSSTDSFSKTAEFDNSSHSQNLPYSYFPPNNYRRPNNQQQQHQRSSSQCPPSPLHRAHRNSPHHHSPITPSPSKTRPLQVRSASPCYHRPQTPSLRSNYFYNGPLSHDKATGLSDSVPNYMAATESARARTRAHSAPRQRPSTPERERSVGSAAKKRLSYPVPDPYNSNGHQMRSPSYKSINGMKMNNNNNMCVEQQSNYSSCYTESLGGEISPSSTSDLRRWLR